MREFTKSLFSYGLAQGIFGVQQMANAFLPRNTGEPEGPATMCFQRVTDVTTQQLGRTLHSAFSAADSVQRGLVNLTFSFLFPWTIGRGRSTGDADERNRPAAERDYSSEPRPWTEAIPVNPTPGVN